MNLLTDNIKNLFAKYLFASMGSALVMSIYSLVDTLAVGQSEGPAGSAAMAIIMPIYEIQVFLAILCGIGGSILMSNAKGEKKRNKRKSIFCCSNWSYVCANIFFMD